MCFEYESGTEDRAYSNPSESGNIQRRPRVCSHDETKNDDNNCICYIIQAAGQSGPKQTPDGAGFRPEIDYLEVCISTLIIIFLPSKFYTQYFYPQVLSLIIYPRIFTLNIFTLKFLPSDFYY